MFTVYEKGYIPVQHCCIEATMPGLQGIPATTHTILFHCDIHLYSNETALYGRELICLVDRCGGFKIVQVTLNNDDVRFCTNYREKGLTYKKNILLIY